jgi:glycosyltransferase involved in cell wall biosynthesis
MSYHREISPHTTSAAVRLSRGTLEFSAISRWMVEANPLSGRWHIVPNGVTLRVYQKQLSVAFDAPLVFLGRIEEIKGPHIAIDVARRSGYSLIIAGNVPVEHHSWFENQIMPHVDGRQIKFVGPVDDAQKNALLGSAAALLMPILWEEPFGLVMAEAMACGTPVIGLARGAVPEVVENGVTGFVVSTVDEMVSAVGRIAELSRGAARARVEQLYSEEVMTDGYIRVYEDILERQTRAGRASLHRAPREK